MGHKRVYISIIEDANLRVGYNMKEIMIYRKDEKNLTISFGNHRKESDIYDNIVSVGNMIGAEVLKEITTLLMSRMCDTLAELGSDNVLKGKNFSIFKGGFNVAEPYSTEDMLTELLHNHQRYLLSLSICQSGVIMGKSNSTLQPGDLIRHNNHVLRIENLYITAGSDYVIVKYKHLKELSICDEAEMFDNKILPGTAEYKRINEMYSVIDT